MKPLAIVVVGLIGLVAVFLFELYVPAVLLTLEFLYANPGSRGYPSPG